VIIGCKNSQRHRVNENQSITKVIANPASALPTLEVEVHHGEDKYTAVKVVGGRSSKESIDHGGGTGTALQLIQQGPKSTGRGRRTLEIASFDNVFAPYIKPPI
jgi:hypothetical protein